MAALCGATKHAIAQKKAGVENLIAQEHEGGGHCAEMVASCVAGGVDAVGCFRRSPPAESQRQ